MLNVNETITFIKPCYKMRCFTPKIWRYAESPYLCNVFFIVLDLRLTKRLAVCYRYPVFMLFIFLLFFTSISNFLILFRLCSKVCFSTHMLIFLLFSSCILKKIS